MQKGSDFIYTYVNADTVGKGVELSLRALDTYGILSQRENQDKEDTCKEIQLCLDIKNIVAEPFISKAMPCDLKALAKYDEEFIIGTADNAGWKYTYHQLYSPYYQKVVDELFRNKYSRRACISLGQGNINFSSDPPCLQLMMFNVVDDKLDATVVFRSNDAVKAFAMNIHAISVLQAKLTSQLDLEFGSLHYIANNFHAYSGDFKTLYGYIKMFDTKESNKRFYSMRSLKKVVEDHEY